MAVVCSVKIWNCNKLFLPKLCELFDVLGAVEEQVINDWAHDFLSSEIFAAFIQEKDELKDLIVLGDETSNLDNFPVHMTLMNIIKKVSMTEAAVERAFLRHRLDHTRLRANLAAKKTDDTLFLRNNCENIFITGEKDIDVVELENKIIYKNWLEIDFD